MNFVECVAAAASLPSDGRQLAGSHHSDGRQHCVCGSALAANQHMAASPTGSHLLEGSFAQCGMTGLTKV